MSEDWSLGPKGDDAFFGCVFVVLGLFALFVVGFNLVRWIGGSG